MIQPASKMWSKLVYFPGYLCLYFGQLNGPTCQPKNKFLLALVVSRALNMIFLEQQCISSAIITDYASLPSKVA